jgi:HEAT repeat protein
MRKPDSYKINAKAAVAILFLVALGFTQNSGSQAQQTQGGPITIASVSSRDSANGTLVSIAADGPLNRAQTWQDREGYHVVVPSTGAQNPIKAGSGIKVRQLDHTLEIVIQTKPGATVAVQPTGNRLNLNIEGKLDPRGSTDSDNTNTSESARQPEENSGTGPQDNSSVARANKSGSEKTGAFASQRESSGPMARPASDPNQGVLEQPETATGESSVVSGAAFMIVLGVVCLGLLFLRNRRAGQATAAAAATTDEDDGFERYEDLYSLDETDEEGNKSGKTRGVQDNLMKLNGSSSNGAAAQRKSLARLPVGAPTALYGAYQVDLEIGKLVHGHPHKMDVVASRAPDDRRAIEASLLKTLSSGGDEDLQRRARVALEEYGFVARQSATLLMSSDPYERTSAARMLGDFKSPAALPFLLEALYDHESLVRNQAVLSIGELRLPSAIGALLDIARKHPDVPGSLLSRALSACSVDGSDFFDIGIPEPRPLSGVNARLLAEEITTLEPAAVVQELPESSDDGKLAQALEQLQNEDLSKRSEAIKMLAQFPVRTSVAALADVARRDQESSIRALAISSLAFINHESVFPAILIAMADESRGVRAAAARSLSRLSFDRADAYIRVTETHDGESLRNVAAACIKAGIAGQGIDRLITGDHQAYEAMSVISLLVKAGVFGPLLEAIASHPNMDVRLTAIHVIALAGHSGLLEQLRQLVNDRPFEATQIALQDAIARLEEHLKLEFAAQPAFEPSTAIRDLEARSDSESRTPPKFAFEEQSDDQSEVQSECERELLELESSGLPAPPIA